MKVEEEYTDILQNIEFAIVDQYRKDRTVLDQDARDAVQALVRRYEAELESQGPPNAPLSSRAKKIYGAAEAVCEWILGRPATSLPLPPESRASRPACWSPASSESGNRSTIGISRAGGRVTSTT
jgi:hypothetical protein